MTFAVPWIFALGIAAATAPVIIHWLTRPRPVRMPLSTLRFVREAIRQRSAGQRLRDFIILGLRTLAILLLAAAFAGPRWGERDRSLIAEDAGDAVRVVVLDVSQSMAAADGNVPAMQRARSIADRYLQYRRGLRTNLIVAGSQPRAVFNNPSTNFEALREELARTEALPQRMGVDEALELAARQLAQIDEQDDRRRELIVISDFQRTGWGGATFAGLPAETQIQLESVAPAEAPANMAILKATCRPLGARHDRLQLEVVVGNYSSTGRTATLEAEIGGGVFRLSAACPPQELTTLTREIPAELAGWVWGEVRLVEADDALAADNTRPLVVELRGEPVYVLISREPEHLRPSSSHILACALVPQWSPDSPTDRFSRVEPSKLDNQSLTEADLIAVDRCGKLSPEHIGLLARQLQRGRSLLYVASESIDAANIDLIAQEAGIELPLRFAPPPAGTIRTDLRLASMSNPQPPLAAFGDSLPSVIDQLRFAGGLTANQRSPTAAQLDDTIRATFTDGTPALVVARSRTGGAMAILNADLAASNIWKTGALVPLIEELVQELLSSETGDGVFLSGEPLVARIVTTTPAQSLRIVQDDAEPETGEALGQLVDDADAAVWQWESPTAAGVYRVLENDETIFAAAVAIPAAESDLATLPPDVIRDRLAAGHEIRFTSRDAATHHEQDTWKWFAVGVVLCMLTELGTLLLFRT